MTTTGIAPIMSSAIRSTPLFGLVGALLSGESWDLVNAEAGVAEVWTLTTGGATNSTTYTVTLKDENGVTVTTASYTSDGSASTAEISAGLLAAIKANALFGAYGSAVATSGTLNTFTGNQKGRAFTLVSSSGDVVAAQSVAATSGTDIGLGIAVVRFPSGGSQLGALPKTYLEAKAADCAVAYAASSEYLLRIVLYPSQQNPIVYEVQVAADTNTATTRAAIVAAINAAVPANSVIAASGSAGAFTVTSEIVGQDFDVQVSVLGTGTLTVTWGNAGFATNLDKTFAGITVRRADVSGSSLVDVTAAYPPGRAMQVGVDDAFIVVPGQSATPSFRDPLYVGVGTSNNGQIFFTAGADKVRLDPKRAWFERQSDGLAVVFVDYL